MDWNNAPVIIQAATGIVGLLMFALAIWGEKIRHYVNRPILELRLHTEHGELNPKNGPQGARHYHYLLDNLRPSSPALKVKVILHDILRPGPDGKFVSAGIISPLQFGYQWIGTPGHDPQPTIVSPRLCDLGFIQNGDEKGFMLLTYIIPNNLDGRVRADERMRVLARAEGDNAISEYVLIEIAWDGKWEAGDSEMKQHLVVKQLPLTELN